MTPDLIARAVVAAARALDFDPILAMEPHTGGPRDGRGRVKQLAAAALISGKHATTAEATAVFRLNKVQVSPSQLIRRGITVEHLKAVSDALPKAAQPAAEPPRRGDDDYVDPRRDTAREAAIVKLRLEGLGASRIARRIGCSLFTVNKAINRAKEGGAVFPVLRPGPGSGERTAKPAAPRPARSKPEPKAVARPVSPVVLEAVEPFPDHHEAWAPLPGSSPARLIDHEKGCRWPVTVAGATCPMVCNQPTPGAGPYCDPHTWLAASPEARKDLTRPQAQPGPVVVARTFSPRDLQDA